MELDLTEGVALPHQTLEFGDPLPQLILTGGDPLQRADLYELIDEVRKLGIGVSIRPAATPALTRWKALVSAWKGPPLNSTIPSEAFPAHSTVPCRPFAGSRNWKCRCR
jgi:hypothetical protein